MELRQLYKEPDVGAAIWELHVLVAYEIQCIY